MKIKEKKNTKRSTLVFRIQKDKKNPSDQDESMKHQPTEETEETINQNESKEEVCA